MTLKGHSNHYNVKFLSGYGHSVTVKDSKLILKDCHDPFTPPSIEEWYPNKMPYEKIVLSGKGYVSTDALSVLSNHNRNLILLDISGKPLMFCSPTSGTLSGTNYRIGQYDTFRDKSKRDYVSRQIVNAKLESQIKFLKSIDNPEISTIKLESHQNSKENTLHLEAVTSRLYFIEFSKLIDERFEFDSRNSPLQVRKNHASDVINALLNYGYSVLAGEISKFVNGVGLDAYYGFYHKNHTGFQSLVYDMIEPFRWMVEYSVWKISDAKSRSRISRKQYAHTRDGRVILEHELIRKFLEILERTFQQERRYYYRHGLKTSDGLKSVQEITVAKITIQNLAEYCLGKEREFKI